MELSACTRGGEKCCNLIAVGPKSGAHKEGQTKTGRESRGKVKTGQKLKKKNTSKREFKKKGAKNISKNYIEELIFI